MIIVPAQNRSEMEACADIWLQASLVAHDFVSADFWHGNYEAMKEQYLPDSDLYLAKENQTILGFAAVYQGMLSALFVQSTSWSKGVGSGLLRHVQGLYAELTLTVYSRNSRAMSFYLHHGFAVSKELVCQHTGEPELLMLWKREGS